MLITKHRACPTQRFRSPSQTTPIPLQRQVDNCKDPRVKACLLLLPDRPRHPYCHAASKAQQDRHQCKPNHPHRRLHRLPRHVSHQQKLTEEEQKLFRLYGKLPTNKSVLKNMQKVHLRRTMVLLTEDDPVLLGPEIFRFGRLRPIEGR